MSKPNPLRAQQLHPDVNEYSITLLDEYSLPFVLERTFDDESEVQIKLFADYSGWVEDVDGKKVLLSNVKIPVWILTSREKCDDLIRLLTLMRDDAFPK